jgi:hypothetical protein
VSLTTLTERVHSDRAIPPGRKYFLLMKEIADFKQEIRLALGINFPGGNLYGFL